MMIKHILILLTAVSIVPSITKAQDSARRHSEFIRVHYDTIPNFLWLSNNYDFIRLVESWDSKTDLERNVVYCKFTDTCGGIEFTWYEEGRKILTGYYKGDCKLYQDTVIFVDPTNGNEVSGPIIYYKPARFGKWINY